MLRRRLMAKTIDEVVLFHFDEKFNGVYKDEYGNAFVLSGYPPDITTFTKKVGARSWKFDNNAKITLDTKLDYQDFTVEAWIRPEANRSAYNWLWMFRVSGSGLGISYAEANKTYTYAYWQPTNTSGNNTYISSSDFKPNEWNHVAIVYNNNTVKAKMYINGVQVGNEKSITWKSRPTHITLQIGNGSSSQAYIDEFKFSTGIKYRGNFTPK